MKRLLALIAVFFLVPAVSLGQERQAQKIIIFPFKVVTKKGVESFNNEMAAVMGAELGREGDVQVISGAPFLSAINVRTVDPARLARIASRVGADSVAWGKVTELDDGQSLEVWVTKASTPDKPRLFTATGKDFTALVEGLKELIADIGTTVLDRPKIGEIKIEGNKRVTREAILNKLKMKPGTAFRRSAVGDEIREIYSLGYFEDVRIDAEETPRGTVDLRIVLKERPSIKEIKVTGNSVFTADEILDKLTSRSFSVASVEKIKDDIEKISKMYEAAGYYQPKIEYEIQDVDQNEANLVFKIQEGQKSYLTDIEFEGNKSLSNRELKKIMNIKEKSWTWFLDESGTFTSEKLEENRLRLMQYYMDRGFIQVQVGAPQVDIHEGKVKVTFPILEGDRFQVRKVNVTGDLILPAEKLEENLKTKPRTWVRRSLIAEDIRELQRLYNNRGHAYVDVEPIQNVNEEHDFMDITYKIDKGPLVHIERVDVAGNDRTRDKVIRRSLVLNEGDLYNADKFEESKKNLEAMDYFDAVRIKTKPGSRPDQMDVTVEVQEKKTGSLSAGIGYSSQDGAMGNVDLKERNLFGLGIIANAKSNLSARRNNYEGSLTYPWFLDYPVTLNLSGYKAVQKEMHYLREGDGFSTSLGFPLYGAWSMSTGIARDSSKLTQFEKVFARSVVEYYKRYNTSAQKYLNIAENSVSVNIGRDTRIGTVIPRGGSKISIGSRISGFGGDVSFSRYFTEAIYYQPLIWGAIFKIRAHGDMLLETGNEPIPFDRRISLGGIQSIRGYRAGEVGPQDKFGNIIGGDRAVYSNLECLFPVVPSMNLNGVAFVDVGNAWNAEATPMLQEVKAGYGVGIRWMSPMGPIRLEYGWKIMPKKGEEPGAFAFAMGQLF